MRSDEKAYINWKENEEMPGIQMECNYRIFPALEIGFLSGNHFYAVIHKILL